MDNIDYEKSLPRPKQRRSKLCFLAYSIFEIVSLVFLFLTTFGFLLSGTSFLPLQAFNPLRIKIQAQSNLAKDTIDIIQQGLKFATYLSNDLNVYANFTTNDTILQKLDTLYDGSAYQFNLFGYCRTDPLAETHGCFDGEGINVVSCFLTDLGMQLKTLTGEEHSGIDDKLVKIYYDLIHQLCRGRMWTTRFPCVLQGYNCMGFLLQYVAILAVSLTALAVAVCLADFVLLYGLFGVSWKFTFRLRLWCIIMSMVCVNLTYVAIFYISQSIEELVQQYQVGQIRFNFRCWIAWDIVFFIAMIFVAKRQREYEKIRFPY
ncbi:uncharacterized protein LODBEIA_P49620 [Lodderomyces beijingensis]|uniref:Uncharacterized protein n=1 Tax=Lodderomyces beijingensis TaxID=1775926 RepID=A0ABP0ZRF3_9ASCO